MAGFPPIKGDKEAIQWLRWDNRAFEVAQREDKPVLLSITAVWCYWCQVMEETTFTDSEVIGYVTDNFIPVQVDNDHRPDVNARYNVGGWPTTAFLNPHGGFIAGATYLPPDQLLAMLVEVRRAYDDDRAGLYDQAAQLHRQRQEYLGRVTPGPELDHRLVDLTARRMCGVYDARNGGFGEEPKFPSAPILQFIIHLYRVTREEYYRAMLEKTLDALLSGELFDGAEGGFFRYCAQGDWTEAQHEKMLEDNVRLARVFMDASLLLGKEEYGTAASRTIDYILDNLADEKSYGFKGSQGAHSDYFTLPQEARDAGAAPPADPFCYAGWTSQAVSLLLEASWKLGRPELASRAAASLERLHEISGGSRLPHAFDEQGVLSPQIPDDADFLADWAGYLVALMDANDYCAEDGKYLQRAEAVAAHLDRVFHDNARGSYFDIPSDPDAAGYMRLREKPLPENVQVAEGLLKLHHATGNTSYRMRAENVLRAYTEANRDFGEHAAGYAVAVDRFLHSPVEITIEGDAQGAVAAALAQAAAAVGYPHVIIKWSGSPPGSGTMAHVCVDTLCYPPVSNPDDLEASVREALEGPGNPVESIFERFVSF